MMRHFGPHEQTAQQGGVGHGQACRRTHGTDCRKASTRARLADELHDLLEVGFLLEHLPHDAPDLQELRIEAVVERLQRLRVPA